MMAGLPGTGIGGLFYLLAALLLPLRFAWLYARGQHDRGHLVLMFKQLAMSTSMIVAVWLTGIVLGLWRPLPTVLTVASITVAPIIVTFGTLSVILLVVEVGRLLIPSPSRRAPAELRMSLRPSTGRLGVAAARRPRVGPSTLTDRPCQESEVVTPSPSGT
jgi:hypothetical protein